ncbi:hypothetical protein JTB14_007531 [Gonioctena quinquepunctata]|nr:hypothetical protein JTB14_007531 [Gonioctena quinquepunctata]
MNGLSGKADDKKSNIQKICITPVTKNGGCGVTREDGNEPIITFPYLGSTRNILCTCGKEAVAEAQHASNLYCHAEKLISSRSIDATDIEASTMSIYGDVC